MVTTTDIQVDQMTDDFSTVNYNVFVLYFLPCVRYRYHLRLIGISGILPPCGVPYGCRNDGLLYREPRAAKDP